MEVGSLQKTIQQHIIMKPRMTTHTIHFNQLIYDTSIVSYTRLVSCLFILIGS